MLFFFSKAFAADFFIANQKIVHTELSNGLDMIWIDDGSTTIDLYTVYAAGQYMDTKPHLAHMTEHAMFCTDQGAFDVLMKPYAEFTNAYTRDEHTTYYNIGIQAEQFSLVLEEELKRMENLNVDSKCFDYEKGRLLEEVGDNHNLLLEWDKDKRSAVFGSGYAGVPSENQDLLLEDVQNFFNLWYQPNRASMIVVGAIGEELWLKTLKDFEQLENRTPVVIDISKPTSTSIKTEYPLSNEKTSWLWRGPSIENESDWLHWMLLSDAHQLKRNNTISEISFSAGMMVSLIEMNATGEDGSVKLKELYDAVLKGETNEELLTASKKTFSNQLQQLPIRGRPYFTVAPKLGYWAAWDQLPTLLNLIKQTKQSQTLNRSNDVNQYISQDKRVDMFNPKGEVGELPTSAQELNDAAQLAQSSGDLSRAIACYEQLLELKPNKINTVIYHYYLAILHLESGDKLRAKDHLLQGLDVVEYPALRELLNEIDNEAPQAPQEREDITPVVQTDRLSFEGEIPSWAEKAAEAMVKIENWRGLKFKEKINIRFQKDAGYDSAGWYDYRTKSLVVGLSGSERFGEGVMLHELYHALQDQHFDLGAIDKRIKSEDQRKALQAVIEGEAMMAVSEIMNYDFLSHVRYTKDMSEDHFQKNFDYGAGLIFVKTIRDSRGWSAVDELYKTPPLSTAMIIQPDRYLAGEDSLLSLPSSLKLSSKEQLISVEAKGGYGWMLFLAKNAPDVIQDFNKSYRKDEYIVFERDNNVYFRWKVDLSSAENAKKAYAALNETTSPVKRKGRWLIWEGPA